MFAEKIVSFRMTKSSIRRIFDHSMIKMKCLKVLAESLPEIKVSFLPYVRKKPSVFMEYSPNAEPVIGNGYTVLEPRDRFP
jgi:hypothetical protein